MPTRLDAALVADALTQLPGWKGDPDKLVMTVDLTDATAATVDAQVNETANAMNHHPVVDRQGTTTTYQVWTHSEGGVTELDVALASRISDIVRRARHSAP